MDLRRRVRWRNRARVRERGVPMGARRAAGSKSGAGRPLPGSTSALRRGFAQRVAHACLAPGDAGPVFDAYPLSARSAAHSVGAFDREGIQRSANAAEFRDISSRSASGSASLDEVPSVRAGMARVGTHARLGAGNRDRGPASNDGEGSGGPSSDVDCRRRNLWNRRCAGAACNLECGEDPSREPAELACGVKRHGGARASVGCLLGCQPSPLLGSFGGAILPPREGHSQRADERLPGTTLRSNHLGHPVAQDSGGSRIASGDGRAMRSPVEVVRRERTRLRRRTFAARHTELRLRPIACDRPLRVGSECGEWRVQRPLVTGWSRSGPVEVRPPPDRRSIVDSHGGKGLALKCENEASDCVVKDTATDERVAIPRGLQSQQRNRHDALRQPIEKATGVETPVA